MTPSSYPSSRIAGLGSFVPPKVVTNADLEAVVGTSPEWIMQRTGISARRVSDVSESTGDLAFEAAQRALQCAEFSARELDLIVVATSTPDYPLFPSTASLLQHRLGASRAAGFDLSAACSGFTFGLHTADQFIKAGSYENVLLVCSDTLTKFVNPSDRSTSIIFGDGAGAVLLRRATCERGLLGSYLRNDGSAALSMVVASGGSRRPVDPKALDERSHHIRMDGVSIFRFAVKAAVDAYERVLEQLGIQPQDVDLVVMHQANRRIVDHVADSLGLPASKVIWNAELLGNTSVASIPLALDAAASSGRLKPHDLVVAIGFGAGLTWGANVIRW